MKTRRHTGGVELTLLTEELSVCRLPRAAGLEVPPQPDGFLSITWTDREISVVSRAGEEPPEARVEPGWRALVVAGPLDFGLTGIMAELSGALAQAGVSLFALSTFDTDYLLVKEASVARALAALEARGHTVSLA